MGKKMVEITDWKQTDNEMEMWVSVYAGPVFGNKIDGLRIEQQFKNC